MKNFPLRETCEEIARAYEENRGLFGIREVLDSFQGKPETGNGLLLDPGCGSGM